MIAYGPLSLKPAEFWPLQPREFYWMLEGLYLKREYERFQHAEMLYLQRRTVTALIQVIESFSKHPKRIDDMDIWPIPEIDVLIEEAREREKQKFEERGALALEKYRNLVT